MDTSVEWKWPGMPWTAVEVAATRWPFVAIGRDVLNDVVTYLDGPALTFARTP
jgi:hypothetical protein